MAKGKKPLDSIKTSAMARSASLTGLALKSGFRFASAKLKGTKANPRILEEVFEANALSLVQELGRLKGSAMKMGQSLAMISEHFFPKEIATILKTLNQDSEPVSWPEMEKTLRRSLGSDSLGLVDIDEEAFAAASLGQVHRARVKATSEELCLKIQYPGVGRSIDSDLKALKSILKVSRLLPSYGTKIDQIFEEVRFMLKMEVDYQREARNMAGFRDWLAGDDRYRIPDQLAEFSSRIVLATSFEEGVGIDSIDVARLAEERRARIAQNYTELFLRELFEYRAIQSDPHFGNYKLRIGKDGAADVLVLLDFGAVRRFSKEFIGCYTDLVWGAYTGDKSMVINGGKGLGYLTDSDSAELLDKFCCLCFLVMEPFLKKSHPKANIAFYDSKGHYRWHDTDLPQRIREEAGKLAIDFRFRPPPRELIFLDRKLAGVFTTLKILKAPFAAYDVLEQVLRQAR